VARRRFATDAVEADTAADAKTKDANPAREATQLSG
jgi:hypothetical protein